jgi:hypothetical protein
MLVIGSVAMEHFGLTDREPVDTDVICTYEEYEKLIKDFKADIIAHYPISGNKFVIKCSDTITEVEIAWPGSVAEELLIIVEKHKLSEHWDYNEYIAYPEVQLALKMSHRYLRNNRHFNKTMEDIWTLREKGYVIPDCLQEWLKRREEETYNYSHPKLKQDKDNFFDTEGVTYKYDHDTLHLAVAIGDRPAYMEFKPEDEEVWCSKEMWDKCSEQTKLNAVLEEAYVLALERWLIPNNFQVSLFDGFYIALEKICTSITSGWFREWAWENHCLICKLFKEQNTLSDNYSIRFNEGLANRTVKEAK